MNRVPCRMASRSCCLPVWPDRRLVTAVANAEDVFITTDNTPIGNCGDGCQQQRLAANLKAVHLDLHNQTEAVGQLAARLSDLCAEADRLAALDPFHHFHNSGSNGNGSVNDRAHDTTFERSISVDQIPVRAFSDNLDRQSSLPSTSKPDGGLFVDADELKAKIRQTLCEKPHDASHYYKKTGCCQAVVRSNKFEFASLALVIASSVWLAVDLDSANSKLQLHESDPLFQAVAHITCGLFVLELLIRIAAFENIRNVAKDRMVCFDIALAFLIVFETWVFTAVLPLVTNLRMVSVFRTLRLVRMLRLIKVFRRIPELMVIVRGLGIALRAILVVLCLLGLIIYVSAIIFRVLLEDTELGASQFPNVLTSMGTLLLDGVLAGTRGAPIIRQAYDQHPISSMLLFCFVLLTNVTMMGVLAGLLVQTVKTVAEVEKEEKAARHMLNMMEHFWSLLIASDENNDGCISEAELHELLMDRKATKLLKKMDVDVESLIDVTDFLFTQRGGTLTQAEFNRVVLDLRGSKKATFKDHVETRKFVHSQLKQTGLMK